MYDAATTRRMIAQTVASLATRAKDPVTWEPVYHSRVQIEHAIDHFNNIYDHEHRRLTRPLTPDEAAFIRNERHLCALDFRGYWLLNYAFIINWAKQPQQFVPNVAQQIVMDLWAEREAQGRAIWMQQLKARRLGVSTISELAVCHRFQFCPYSNSVVASADPNKTVQMAGMIKFALDQQPWWLLPEVSKVKNAIPVEHGKIHTTLTIEAGNQFTGVARGSTPNVIHLSELCEWQDAEELVDGALMRAILDTPDVFGILESTGGGVGNWWHRTWEQNKRDFQRGRARVIPVFLPWFVGTDLYPTEADLRARPIEEGWIPSDRSIAHAERARAYVLSNPLLFQHLAKYNADWQLSREQMWFREMEYETAKEKKQLNIFLAELCADDFEAFQSSNIPVVDQEVLMAYQERTRQPRGVYTIIGPDIPPNLVVARRHWDPSKPTITIKTRDLLPRFDATYQLVPLQFHGYPSFDEALKLLVWDFPEDNFQYGIGVDTGDGIGQDNSVIEVMREATPLRPPAQVAEFAYDYIKAFQLWPLVMAVASWYSVHSPRAGKRLQTKLCIECRGNGEACQHELQKRGWSAFHVWKRYDNKTPTPDAKAHKIGIYTNQWFRAQMMDMLLTSVEEEAIDLPSPYMIQELVTLERDPDQQKQKAAYGANDDRIMGIGFPLFSLHVGKAPRQQYSRRKVEYAPGLQGDPMVVHPIWTPGAQASSQPFAGRLVQPLTQRRSGTTLERVVNPHMPRGYR